MESYFSNQALTMEVALVDTNGNAALNPTNVNFRVVNSRGEEVQASTPATAVAGTGLAQCDITAAANQLESGQIRAFRQVEVTFQEDGNTYTSFAEYLIELADTLIPMSNSFQTYGDAMVLLAETPGLDVFESLTRKEKATALISAYRALVALQFRVGCEEIALPFLTLAEFEALPAAFQQALKKAQLVEANEAMNQFSIEKKRQLGLMSETIGESSMMFRPAKILNIPMTHRSLDILRPYLVWDVSIGRA